MNILYKTMGVNTNKQFKFDQKGQSNRHNYTQAPGFTLFHQAAARPPLLMIREKGSTQ